MNARSWLGALACCLIAGPRLASAADLTGDVPPHVGDFTGGDGKSAAADFSSSLNVEAGDADSKATLNISNFFKTNTGRIFRYRLQASAPFDRKEADSVDIGDLSGLTAGTSAKLEWGVVDWPDANNDRATALERYCAESFPQLIEGGYTYQQIGAWVPMKCGDSQKLDVETFKAAVKKLAGIRKACTVDKPPPASEGVPCADIGKLGEPALATNAEDLLKDAPRKVRQHLEEITQAIRIWSLGVTGNRQQFKYVLPEAPTAAIKDKQQGWGVTAAYSWLSDNHLWSMGFSHEESWEPKDKVDVCSPIGSTGSLSCSSAIIGAPEEKTSELAFVEYRWSHALAKVAVSPRAQYDFEESEWAVRVPIYLARNKDGALTGGITFGYSSSDEDLGVAVFIGKEFGFFDE